MRIERNLSLDGLAALVPTTTKTGRRSRRSLSWLSKIEKGQQEPNMADLGVLARELMVSVDWLVRGHESGETEFSTQLRHMELLMDERGRREVLATAQRQIEATATADAEFRRRLRETELDDATIDRVLGAGPETRSA
jgi:transcriptional regulator with XRE-family HTH domain